MSVLFSVYAPGSINASNYISICDKAVGDHLFLYEHLIRNKIVPERWFTFEELSISFSPGSGRYILYRRKPKKEVMTLRAIRGYASFAKAKKIKTGVFGEPFTFVPITLDRAEYVAYAQGPQGVPGIEPQEPAPPPVRPYADMIRELAQTAQRLQRTYPDEPAQVEVENIAVAAAPSRRWRGGI